jgi:hypothetical protein
MAKVHLLLLLILYNQHSLTGAISVLNGEYFSLEQCQQ